MKRFEINERIVVECEWKKTRTAFKHVAVLLVDGQPVTETKICYLNRTWERFEFESVLHQVIDKTRALTKEEKILAVTWLQNYREPDHFGPMLAVMKLGSLFASTPKEKNDWDKRMLQAGIGADFPEEFDQLPEEERAKRLNGVKNLMREGPR